MKLNYAIHDQQRESPWDAGRTTSSKITYFNNNTNFIHSFTDYQPEKEPTIFVDPRTVEIEPTGKISSRSSNGTMNDGMLDEKDKQRGKRCVRTYCRTKEGKELKDCDHEKSTSCARLLGISVITNFLFTYKCSKKNCALQSLIDNTKKPTCARFKMKKDNCRRLDLLWTQFRKWKTQLKLRAFSSMSNFFIKLSKIQFPFVRQAIIRTVGKRRYSLIGVCWGLMRHNSSKEKRHQQQIV